MSFSRRAAVGRQPSFLGHKGYQSSRYGGRLGLHPQPTLSHAPCLANLARVREREHDTSARATTAAAAATAPTAAALGVAASAATPTHPNFQDGLRSGLEAAAGITGKAVPWVLAPTPASAATAAAAVAAAAPPGSPSADAAPPSSSPSSSLPPSPTRRLSVASHASVPPLSRGLVLPQPRVCLAGRTTWVRRVAGWGVSAVEALAVRAIAGFLQHTVAKGCMTIACPDGREMRFGDPGVIAPEEGDGTSSGAGRKVAIRVFDWWFFVRVAMEYDLGLARCAVASLLLSLGFCLFLLHSTSVVGCLSPLSAPGFCVCGSPATRLGAI